MAGVLSKPAVEQSKYKDLNQAASESFKKLTKTNFPEISQRLKHATTTFSRNPNKEDLDEQRAFISIIEGILNNKVSFAEEARREIEGLQDDAEAYLAEAKQAVLEATGRLKESKSSLKDKEAKLKLAEANEKKKLRLYEKNNTLENFIAKEQAKKERQEAALELNKAKVEASHAEEAKNLADLELMEAEATAAYLDARLAQVTVLQAVAVADRAHSLNALYTQYHLVNQTPPINVGVARARRTLATRRGIRVNSAKVTLRDAEKDQTTALEVYNTKAPLLERSQASYESFCDQEDAHRGTLSDEEFALKAELRITTDSLQMAEEAQSEFQTAQQALTAATQALKACVDEIRFKLEVESEITDAVAKNMTSQLFGYAMEHSSTDVDTDSMEKIIKDFLNQDSIRTEIAWAESDTTTDITDRVDLG